jgi:hypothetical protein
MHEKRVRTAAMRLFKKFHIRDRCWGDCSCRVDQDFAAAFAEEFEKVNAMEAPTRRE